MNGFATDDTISIGTSNAENIGLSASQPQLMMKLLGMSSTPKILDGTSALYFDGGSGTEADPYQIATAEQLALLADVINDYKWSDDLGGAGATYKRNNATARIVTRNGLPQAYATLQTAYYKLTADICRFVNDMLHRRIKNREAPF